MSWIAENFLEFFLNILEQRLIFSAIGVVSSFVNLTARIQTNVFIFVFKFPVKCPKHFLFYFASLNAYPHPVSGVNNRL